MVYKQICTKNFTSASFSKTETLLAQDQSSNYDRKIDDHYEYGKMANVSLYENNSREQEKNQKVQKLYKKSAKKKVQRNSGKDLSCNPSLTKKELSILVIANDHGVLPLEGLKTRR